MTSVLDEPTWTARQAAHHERVDSWISPHLDRARRGHGHPVHDFLFTYYSHRPGQLRRWHPGFGVRLAGDAPHAAWPGYRSSAVGTEVDPGLPARRADTIGVLIALLRATAGRRPEFGCFGMHEWAMVYRTEEIRHGVWPLRLAPDELAEVVEAAPLRCTHYDAFRFFSPTARPRNAFELSRATMPEREQGGCLHTNMDLYRVAYKLTPLIPSELVADCFALAREIRELDMRASPYDLTALGYRPVRVETVAGRAEYVTAQREFAERASVLRARLLSLCEPLCATMETPSSAPGVAPWNSRI